MGRLGAEKGIGDEGVVAEAPPSVFILLMRGGHGGFGRLGIRPGQWRSSNKWAWATEMAQGKSSYIKRPEPSISVNEGGIR
ncbi:hypothetical protein LIER_31875 [Lithospermum erythrorhizon]|uniref:Uncharacterized protein n=1 Tax=Lithospermum erythrorhizon TaxID=34254 RepID=A0AAV3RW21_LITER